MVGSAIVDRGQGVRKKVRGGRLVDGGWLQLPSDVRRALKLGDGNQVVMRVVEGELRIRPACDVLKRIQATLRSYAPLDGSVAEDLFAERQIEAARD